MKWLNQFRLTQTEKRGFLVLIVITNLMLAWYMWLRFGPSPEPIQESTLLQEIEEWEAEQREDLRVSHHFDPNKVEENTILSFKLPQYTKENWLKYRSYRTFKEPEDVLGIYGMDTTWYEVNKDSIVISTPGSSNGSVDGSNPATLFYFDPNTATKSDFVKLGFPESLANRMVNYREKGGHFKEAADLLKIYNFPEDLFKRVEPFVLITEDDLDNKEEKSVDVRTVLVELNSADSLALIEIQGVGPVFASRIIMYRKKLGGFVLNTQLLEVYGIDEERLADLETQIRIDPSLVKQLNINELSFKQLLQHPYLNFDQVKSIVNYRETIGPHQKVADLINLEGFDENDLKRLIAYLTVD